MSKFKIVNVEPYGEDYSIEKKVAEELNAETVFIKNIDHKAIYKEIPDCNALVIQYLTIDDALLDHMPNCKIIVRSAIGVNNIDLEACAKRKVMVANVPDYMQGEVADHIMSMFLAINRKVLYLNARVRAGYWKATDAHPIHLLKTQSMGIIGCGQIGQMTAKRAQSFGMKIYGYDPYLPKEVFAACNITQVETIEKLFDLADHISVHMPLTPETEHLVNYERLCRLKPHSIVLNSSRGPIVSNEDLYKALKEKKIYGAALDVLEVEPPEASIPLAEFDSVLFSPHVGYYSEEALENMKRKSFEEVVRTIRDGQPKHWVNKKFFQN